MSGVKKRYRGSIKRKRWPKYEASFTPRRSPLVQAVCERASLLCEVIHDTLFMFLNEADGQRH